MKAFVTPAEVLQIEGLLALGRRHVDLVNHIEHALMEITGETETGGHSGDALWSGEAVDAKYLIAKLGIKVEPEGVQP